MMDYRVFIPSKGRSGKISTINLFPDAVIVVPDNELKEYKDFGYKNVVGCPVQGITRTRNWILDNFEDERMIQVDDDAKFFQSFESGERVRFFDPKRIDALMRRMFLLCEDWGRKLFGFNMANDKKFYRDYSSFSTLTVIGANILGIIKNPLRFDERLKVKEDYDYSLQHILKYRGVVKLNKYVIQVEHLTNSEGCVGYRTFDTEMEAYEILKKKWGSSIIRLQKNKNFVEVGPPLKGI